MIWWIVVLLPLIKIYHTLKIWSKCHRSMWSIHHQKTIQIIPLGYRFWGGFCCYSRIDHWSSLQSSAQPIKYVKKQLICNYQFAFHSNLHKSSVWLCQKWAHILTLIAVIWELFRAENTNYFPYFLRPSFTLPLGLAVRTSVYECRDHRYEFHWKHRE